MFALQQVIQNPDGLRGRVCHSTAGVDPSESDHYIVEMLEGCFSGQQVWVPADVAQKEWATISGIGADSRIMAGVLDWIGQGQTCVSSMALAWAALGKDENYIRAYAGRRGRKGGESAPQSGADFGRCAAFLAAVPCAFAHLSNLRGLGQRWEILVDNWSELTALVSVEADREDENMPVTFGRMEELYAISDISFKEKAKTRQGRATPWS